MSHPLSTARPATRIECLACGAEVTVSTRGVVPSHETTAGLRCRTSGVTLKADAVARRALS